MKFDLKAFIGKIIKVKNDIVERTLLTTIIVLFIVITPLIIISINFGIYVKPDFVEQLLVQAHGMVFDITIIGVLLYWLNQNGERIASIRNHKSEIDDFRTWISEESAFRIVGNIKRLNRYKIYNIDLTDCHLPNTNLSYVNLKGSNINSANLSRTTMLDTNLENTRLNQTNFEESNLNQAVLKGSYANAANFSNASLIKSDLSNAFLIKTSFKNSYLLEADLRNAYVMNADFDNASLYKADFRGAKGLTVEQLLKAKTLYLAKFDEEILIELKKNSQYLTNRIVG